MTPPRRRPHPVVRRQRSLLLPLLLVDPDDVSDDEAKLLSRSLRDRIEDELEYPSSIRITIIREQRFTDTAK